MRVVVQRVSQSNVKVSGEIIGEINEGLMAVSYTHLTLPTTR